MEGGGKGAVMCPKPPNCILEGRRRARAKRPPAVLVSPRPPAQASSSPLESRALKASNPPSDTSTPGEEGGGTGTPSWAGREKMEGSLNRGEGLQIGRRGLRGVRGDCVATELFWSHQIPL